MPKVVAPADELRKQRTLYREVVCEFVVHEDAGTPMAIRGPEQVMMLFDSFGNAAREHFAVVHLDSRSRVVSSEMVSMGTVQETLVHPREIFGSALQLRASSVILVHNHPSGNVSPSVEDRTITRRLVLGGALVGMPVHDHVIVSRREFYSMREHEGHDVFLGIRPEQLNRQLVEAMELVQKATSK